MTSSIEKGRMPKIVLFGCEGQVGWELQRSLAPLGPLWALGRHSERNPGGFCGDVSNLKGVEETLQTIRPQVIVNAAAYTAVDQAQEDLKGAHLINAQAPAVMAEQAHKLGAIVVHYSSDYVYDGSGQTPWHESATPNPLSVYGGSKLQGDLAIKAICDQHLIFRTSWVYGARGGNFAKTMLKLACEKEELRVVGDQVGAPTGADLIADVTAHALRSVSMNSELCGLYHLVAKGATSWHGYAQHALSLAAQRGVALRVHADQVKAIRSDEFPRPAPRPLNCRLDTQHLCNTFGLTMPAWEKGVTRLIASLDLATFPLVETRNLGQ